MFNAESVQDFPGYIREFQVTAIKTGIVQGHLAVSVPGLEINEFKIGFHVKLNARVLGIKHFQGIGGMGIHRNDFFDAVGFKLFRHKFGVLDEPFVVPKIVEQDAAVKIQVGFVENTDVGFFKQFDHCFQNVVAGFLVRFAGHKDECQFYQQFGDILL